MHLLGGYVVAKTLKNHRSWKLMLGTNHTGWAHRVECIHILMKVSST